MFNQLSVKGMKSCIMHLPFVRKLNVTVATRVKFLFVFKIWYGVIIRFDLGIDLYGFYG